MKLKLLLFAVACLVISVLIAGPVMASPSMALIRGKLACFTETGNCVEGWNSTDITLYSNAGSTQQLNLDGALGHIDTEGNITLADYLVIEAQTAITVTEGGVVTPTGSYQPLQASGDVSGTLGVCGTAGREVIFINTVAQTIIITEGGNTVLSGNASLGQYDALTVFCDGTRWVQIAPESDN